MVKKSHWLYRNYDIIESLILPNSSVLDLGCGTGDFLKLLKQKRNIHCQGVEIDETKIVQCIKNCIPVIQGDLDEGLRAFQSNSFDYVLLNQTLQMVKKPELVLSEMLRVGRKAIVGFPNFGHYKIRWHLLKMGTMPVTQDLSFDWFDSPNIHLLTIKDFRNYCKSKNYKILDEFFLMREKANSIIHLAPNFLATEAVFLLER